MNAGNEQINFECSESELNFKMLSAGKVYSPDIGGGPGIGSGQNSLSSSPSYIIGSSGYGISNCSQFGSSQSVATAACHRPPQILELIPTRV